MPTDILIYSLKAPDVSYTLETRQHEGLEYWVVPVVMMKEGVHGGSHGPLLHLAEDLGHFVDSWNGIPVTVRHPQKDGKHVSANSPEILESYSVGRVYDAYMDGDKLKGTAWINPDKLKSVSQAAYECLKDCQPLDVSVGVFTDDVEESGQWNEESYTGVAKNHRPDHLALLPGAKGACSWEDGCGIRVNADPWNKEMSMDNDDLSNHGGPGSGNFGHAGRPGKVGGSGSDRSGSGRGSAKVGTEIKFGKLPGHAGYSFKKIEDGWQYKTRSSNWKKIKNKELIEVVEDFVSENVQNNKGEKQMAEKEGCCPEKVEMLIQNEHSKFDEKDRDFLLGLTAEQLEKLEPVIIEKEITKEVQMNQEQAIQVLKAELSDMDKFMSFLPEKIKTQFEHGLKLHEEKRQELITEVLANQAVPVWQKEDLDKMDIGMLGKISQAIKPKTSFVPFGSVSSINTNEDEMLLPLGIGK